MGQGHDARPLRREVGLPDRSARRWAANLVELDGVDQCAQQHAERAVRSGGGVVEPLMLLDWEAARDGDSSRDAGRASAGGVGLERWRVPAGTDMSTSVAQAAQPQGPGSACRTCLACQTRCRTGRSQRPGHNAPRQCDRFTAAASAPNRDPPGCDALPPAAAAGPRVRFGRCWPRVR